MVDTDTQAPRPQEPRPQEPRQDDSRIDDEALETALAESLTELAAEPSRTVSEDEFVEAVGGAREAVGGQLLFKMGVDRDGEGEHVAAASIGEGGGSVNVNVSGVSTGQWVTATATDAAGNTSEFCLNRKVT